MVDYSDTELGRATQYTDGLDADLLYPIARSKTRRCSATLILPFVGGDQWTAYELSWLGPGGLPQIAIAEFWVSLSITSMNTLCNVRWLNPTATA